MFFSLDIFEIGYFSFQLHWLELSSLGVFSGTFFSQDLFVATTY